ncbi:TetR/AcrR family transcriptional regulator [Paraclostridium tenue]
MANNTHSEKEILIFNAVNKLLHEGIKLHTVKVADIAKEAGIGKGTIYDYFKSKEEILEKAFLYNMDIELYENIEKIKFGDNFKDKFYIILDIVEKSTTDYSSFSNILFSNLSHHEFKEILEKNKDYINKRYDLLKKVINELLLIGVSENIIKEQEDKDYQIMVFESVVVGFGHTICIKNEDEKIIEDSKSRAYKLLIKGLN